MKFVLSGGGTAGHINPALAVATELLSRGHQVLFAGTPQGLESRLVPEAGIPFTAFEASGFDRHRKSTLVTSTLKILKSTGAAEDWLRAEAPDAVIGFGGYVSIPVGRAASKLHIPLLIHEQNSVAGMTNRYLARHADCVALTYAVAEKGLDTSAPVVVTGNPVRAGIFGHGRDESRRQLHIPADARYLLVFGGSLGARHLNTALCQLAPTLLERPDLTVFHITGPKELDTVADTLRASGVSFDLCDKTGGLLSAESAGAGSPSGAAQMPDASSSDVDGGPSAVPSPETQRVPGARWRLFGYFDLMGPALSAADACVARAGATSIAEISALGVPALLVPFPYATENHQTLNAQALVDAGAAVLVADAEVETPAFRDQLLRMLDDAEARHDMSQAALRLDTGKATERVADLACQVAQG